eukprot:2850469-Alexandrium_andersonii.AAC.1
MSASLVGSEMCIRDRLNTRRSQICTRSNNSELPAHSRLHRRSQRATRGCLLYTSDAADDA